MILRMFNEAFGILLSIFHLSSLKQTDFIIKAIFDKQIRVYANPLWQRSKSLFWQCSKSIQSRLMDDSNGNVRNTAAKKY